MCGIGGGAGTPRTDPGWLSPAAATPPGGFFGRIRTGYKWDTAGSRWDTTGYEQDTNHGGTAQRLDRLSAAAAEAVSECQTWPRRHKIKIAL